VESLGWTTAVRGGALVLLEWANAFLTFWPADQDGGFDSGADD